MQSLSQTRVPGAGNRQAGIRVSQGDACFASRRCQPAFRRQTLAVAVASVLFAGMMPWHATAATYTWDGGGPSGDWNSLTTTLGNLGATNWNGVYAIPGNGDSLTFAGTTRLSNTNSHLASIANLTFAANAGAFTLGGDGLTVTGALSNLSNNVQTINLPLTVGATGKTWDGGAKGINLNGAFTLGNHNLTLNNKIAIDNASAIFTIGDSGTAALTFASGSSLSSGTGYLGNTSGSNGTATVTGAGAQWTNTGGLNVGKYGSGALNIQSGGKVSNTYGQLGVEPGSSGTATVTGADSQWTNASNLYVGNYGSGTLNIQNGGKVNSVQGYLGYSVGGIGTVTVDGTGSLWMNTNGLSVGNGSTLNIQNGGKVTASSLSIGSLGVVNLRGGILSLPNGTIFDADEFNWTSGTLNYTGNASLSSFLALRPGMTLEVGNTLTIASGAALLFSNNQVKSSHLTLLGGSILATGSVNITDIGGLTGYGTVSGVIAGGAGKKITASSGTLTLGHAAFNGTFVYAGALDTGANQVVLLSADAAQLGASTTLGAGGRLSTVNGANLGSGKTLSFTGNASIDGNFTHNGAIIGTGGALTFLDDVTGAGSFAGNIVFKGAYNPGNSPATVNFNGGDAFYDATSVLTLEILGGAPGAQYDQLVGIDTLTFNGRLKLVFGDGYMPAAGSSFTLFGFNSFAGSLASDRIDVVGYDRAQLDFSRLATDGTLSLAVAAVPEPETYALMLIGLGLVAMAARRRKMAGA